MQIKFSQKIYKILALGYLLTIFVVSSFPLVLPEIYFDPRKLIFHFFEYFLLSFLIFKSINKKEEACLLSSIYGLLDEIHQFYVPSRTFDFFDILADISGSFFLLIFCLFES